MEHIPVEQEFSLSLIKEKGALFTDQQIQTYMGGNFWIPRIAEAVEYAD